MLQREKTIGEGKEKKLQNLSSEDKKPPILSFMPEKNKLKYPHVTPGIYLFVQDTHSNEVFLWPTNSGHGHPFLATLVNRQFKREDNDFSWVGAAGEIIFGEQVLGLSYCTGFFHKALKLTEPKETEAYA